MMEESWRRCIVHEGQQMCFSKSISQGSARVVDGVQESEQLPTELPIFHLYGTTKQADDVSITIFELFHVM